MLHLELTYQKYNWFRWHRGAAASPSQSAGNGGSANYYDILELLLSLLNGGGGGGGHPDAGGECKDYQEHHQTPAVVLVVVASPTNLVLATAEVVEHMVMLVELVVLPVWCWRRWCWWCWCDGTCSSGGNGGIGVQIPTTYRNSYIAASVGGTAGHLELWFAGGGGGGGGKGHPGSGTGGGGSTYAGALWRRWILTRFTLVVKVIVVLLVEDLAVVLHVNLMVVEVVLVLFSLLIHPN